jgi:hypothetical protein
MAIVYQPLSFYNIKFVFTLRLYKITEVIN